MFDVVSELLHCLCTVKEVRTFTAVFFFFFFCFFTGTR